VAFGGIGPRQQPAASTSHGTTRAPNVPRLIRPSGVRCAPKAAPSGEDHQTGQHHHATGYRDHSGGNQTHQKAAEFCAAGWVVQAPRRHHDRGVRRDHDGEAARASRSRRLVRMNLPEITAAAYGPHSLEHLCRHWCVSRLAGRVPSRRGARPGRSSGWARSARTWQGRRSERRRRPPNGARREPAVCTPADVRNE